MSEKIGDKERQERPYTPSADIDGRMKAVLEALASDIAACAALSFMEETEESGGEDDC